MAAVAPLPNAQWEFVVFESKEANAFCLPGGKIAVFTGILPHTKTEAGLAAVMGHEMAHAVARHGSQRMLRTTLANTMMTGANFSLGDMDPGQRQAVLADRGHRLWQVGVPDAVFAVLAARVGLVAVAVAKTGVDAQPHLVARAHGAQLVQHVDAAGVHRDAVLHHAGQRGAVQQVGGEDDAVAGRAEARRRPGRAGF